MTVRKSRIHNQKTLAPLGFALSLLLACSISILSRPETLTVQAASEDSNLFESDYSGLVYTNPETGYTVVLEDDADLLYERQRSALVDDMKPITDYGDVAFKSIDSNYQTTRDYADDYYHSQFGYGNGTLFLIDMDNREIYIFSDGDLYKTITKGVANTITDNVYSYASKADYYTCAATAYRQMYAKLSGQRIAQPMKYLSNAFLALILALLINYLFVKGFSKAKKPTNSQLLDSIYTRCDIQNPRAVFVHQTKVYDPPSSGSSGGGGGGGHSGGGGGHSF